MMNSAMACAVSGCTRPAQEPRDAVDGKWYCAEHVACNWYPFTEEEFAAAAAEWGCNCGPSALAFALRVKLDVVRPAIPGFDEKRYTSPTMMKAALANLGRTFVVDRQTDVSSGGSEVVATLRGLSLVRLQWTGPWTAPGANPRWAYRVTHWVAAWPAPQAGVMVFDCNGGVRTLASWESEIVPLITSSYKRADGGWFPTHMWRLV